MTGPGKPHRWLAALTLATLALALVLALVAFAGLSSHSMFSGGAWRLTAFGGFLFFNQIAVTAGIILAVLRRSLSWALAPAVGILALFLMLFPAFEVFQAVRT